MPNTYCLNLVDGLPMYILRLATEVSFADEMSCFDTFARETARFYRFVPKHYFKCL